MKKKIIIISLCLLLIISATITGILIFKNLNNKDVFREEKSFDEKRLLLEKTFMNIKTDTIYKGVAIFDDGTVYKWDVNYQNNLRHNISSYDEHKNWILNNSQKEDILLSDKDLNTLEKNIPKINVKLKRKLQENDIEKESINAFDKKGKLVVISNTGILKDIGGDVSANNVMEILSKYIKE